MRSKTLKIVLQDGTPYGVKTVELSNWNGKAIIANRSALKRLKELPDADLPAVYFLLSDDSSVYVGETDALGNRLAQHAIHRPNWSELIAFTSPKLTKTDVKYLEHVLIKRISEDGLVKIENQTAPKSPNIAFEDQDTLEEFVDRISDILLTLGFEILGATEDTALQVQKTGTKVFCIGPNANAVGIYSENGLLVLRGSIARRQETPSFQKHPYFQPRQNLVETKVMEVGQNGDEYVFSQDHLFPSASKAAAFVLARAANGMTEWKTKDGKTLKELESQER